MTARIIASPSRCAKPGRRALLFIALASAVRASFAQAADEIARAGTFIREAGNQLGDIARVAGTQDARRAALKSFLERVVDLPDLARYCLGRFWAQAGPEWRKQYEALFETVILLNVLNRFGTYGDSAGGATHVVIGNAVPVGDEYEVPTAVETATVLNIAWRVSFASGQPKIVDVSAAGISLRVTLRSDFASYLRQNGNDLNVLLNAMRQMVTRL
jgi:phospholipid transport system substrate-binding protein